MTTHKTVLAALMISLLILNIFRIRETTQTTNLFVKRRKISGRTPKIQIGNWFQSLCKRFVCYISRYTSKKIWYKIKAVRHLLYSLHSSSKKKLSLCSHRNSTALSSPEKAKLLQSFKKVSKNALKSWLI